MRTTKIAYRVDEAAHLLSLSRSALYKDIASGALPAVKRGRSTRLLDAALRKYARSLKPVKPKKPAKTARNKGKPL